MPNIQSAETLRANADLLRRLATAIALAGEPLAEVCERIALDIRAESASRVVDRPAAIDGVVRRDATSETAGRG